jgi:hypothetical protein
MLEQMLHVAPYFTQKVPKIPESRTSQRYLLHALGQALLDQPGLERRATTSFQHCAKQADELVITAWIDASVTRQRLLQEATTYFALVLKEKIRIKVK